ncbi:jg12674, partial [Pararge aegeria aegeria]
MHATRPTHAQTQNNKYLKLLGTACISIASASRTTRADVNSTRTLNTKVHIGSITFASGCKKRHRV